MSQNVIVNVNGIQTEFRRAFGTKPVVGDYVAIDNAWCSFGEYKTGDVLVVTKTRPKSSGGWYLNTTRLDGTNVDNTIVPREYVVLQPTNIVVVDSKRYTKVHRQPQIGDQVLITGNQSEGQYHWLVLGTIGTVTYVGSMTVEVTGKHELGGGNKSQMIFRSDLQVVKPVDARESAYWWEKPSATLSTGIPTPSNPLEKRVAELESQVETLQSEVDELKTAKTTITVSAPTITLTRDQIVADAIADFKRLVEIGTNTRSDLDKGPFQNLYYHVANVSVDSAAGTVKVTVTNGHAPKYAGDVTKTATAKTLPGDVFNEHIGKIIALYRALGLDVPAKYLKVPAPIGKQVGDIVEVDWSSGIKKRLKLVDTKFPAAPVIGEECHVKSYYGDHSKLVDDSARYTV